MIRGTTPRFALTIEGFDLTGKEFVVTLASGKVKINKTNAECGMTVRDGNSILIVPLTQEESFSFKKGTVAIQVNWIDSQGIREATTESSFSVAENLYEEVMEYGGE